MPLTCVYVSFFSVSDGNSCAHLFLARRRSYLQPAWATFRLARTIFQGLLTLSRQATDSGDVSMGTQAAPEVGDNSRDTELTAERPRGHRDTACTGATIKSTCVSSNFDKRCLSASLLHMYFARNRCASAAHRRQVQQVLPHNPLHLAGIGQVARL